MSIAQKIDQDLIAAMKARDELRLSVLRMAKTALKLKQVELGRPLEDPEVSSILRTLVKQRHESAGHFRRGGREAMANKEEAEIRIVEEYLPAAATDEEIEAAVAQGIAETGVEPGPGSEKNLGKVMKAAMAHLAGKNADGKRVSEETRRKLGL